jgi:hypothetical protein
MKAQLCVIGSANQKSESNETVGSWKTEQRCELKIATIPI